MTRKSHLRVLSLRVKLLSAVALLALGLIWVCAYMGVYPAYHDWRRGHGLETANRMADHLLDAAKLQARERGLTNTLLSQVHHTAAIKPQLVASVREQRQTGDRALALALTLADELSHAEWISPVFRRELDALRRDHKTLLATRQLVDELVAGQPRRLDAQTWLHDITALIESGAHLRQSAFLPLSHRDQAMYINQNLKEAIWGASEYAGRERALIGQVIASGQPMSAEIRDRLLGYRSQVTEHIEELTEVVERVLHASARDAADTRDIELAMASMKEGFLGRYEQVRGAIYAQKDSGQYPITPDEWIARATEAIDSILAVNQAVSRYVMAQLELEHRHNVAKIGFNSLSIVIAMTLGGAAVLIVFGISRRIDRFVQTISTVEKDKDLTRQLEHDRADELGRIAAAFNSFLNNMDGLIAKALDSMIDVADAASAMSAVAEQTHAGITIQQTETEEVTGAVDQMVVKINEVAAHSDRASQAAQKAREEASNGGQVTERTIAAITTLASDIRRASEVVHQFERHSQEIGGIVEVIGKISDQTNLLALNAAIEAARAGDSGRGFAVVADEVRSLAKRTHISTQEIQRLIQGLQQSSADAIHLMQQSNQRTAETVQWASRTGSALQAIIGAVDAIADINGQIALTTREQASVSNGISANLLANIRQFSHLAKQSIEKTQRATVSLGSAIGNLQKHLKQYHFNDSDHLKFHAAHAAHMAWVVCVRSFLDGQHDMSEQEAFSAADSAFGQWYYSTDAAPYHDIPEMGAIAAPHQELHQTAQRIKELKGLGRTTEAQDLRARFDRLAHEVTRLLQQVAEKIGAVRLVKHPVTAGGDHAGTEADVVLF